MSKNIKKNDLESANKELVFQNKEKEKRAEELHIANIELAYQIEEKEKRAQELIIANKELQYQNEEKEKRAQELIIANKELLYQNKEKEKRASELIIANKKLIFESTEKKKRASELVIADKELLKQQKEKGIIVLAKIELEKYSDSLKMASEYSRSLIEAIRDPLFTISPNGTITDTNEASVQATGVTRENLIGSEFIHYFTEPKLAKKIYLEVFEKGFVVDFPLTINDGELMDVLFNGSVYKNEKGKVIGAVVIARDITESNKVAKELGISKVFAELALEKAENSQIEAENNTKIAQDAVKSKQQFLSNMSHEIRTPMNAIIGFTKVILKTELTEKQREYLNAIKTSGDALIVLINDILDLAKVEAGKMSFEKIPFRLSSSISSMLHLFEPKIFEKNLQLITEYDKRIPDVVMGDSVRLHQIILNLVSNAVKFTNEGSIKVAVELLSENEQKVSVQFMVKDTGIGIADSNKENIFDDFQQASSGTSRIYGGTGLGLAIVKKLVEAQDGIITLTSEIGKGSSFTFTLVFEKTTNEPRFEEILELDEENKNIKVLVVEDILLNQLLMKTLLDDFGFERDIASNGRIAIEKLESKTFDIILMDLQMPEMNGFDATDYIRNTMNSKVPIIALTADVTTADLARCTAVGMNDYIAKPVDERILYSKIVGLVKKRSKMKEQELEYQHAQEKLKYVDLKYLNQRTKSNPQLMMEMIKLYLDQTPELITMMKKSYTTKDWEGLASAVHKIIPSFSIMGINNDYEQLARKIYESTKAQQMMEEIEIMLSKLEDVCTNACSELTEEYNKIKLSI
jgi:PAS domain S-box-containing protein